jgi:hypothetical protein
MRGKVFLVLSFGVVAAAAACSSRTIEEPLHRDTMKTEIDGAPVSDDDDARDEDAAKPDGGCRAATRDGDC